MNLCRASDVAALKKPAKGSRKGENGVLLVVGGSKEYFGAPIHSLRAASFFVDLAFFSPFPENNSLARKVKIANQDVIVVSDWRKAAERADALLVGPGLAVGAREKSLVDYCVGLGKPVVLDAGAIKLVSKDKLHSRVALTPHAGEFKNAFGLTVPKGVAAAPVVKRVATESGCNILLKNAGIDLITDGKQVFLNKSGIPAMTKGGTGDVLAGLAAAFACRNDLLLSLRAAAYLNGAAARELEKKRGWAFTATDLAESVPDAYAGLLKK
ncbi:NAD(P)H-hydrate dehydratase [Candidatus Micrarchaeota archaeon CG1_02_55_22]|nr:MAG: NAD(P)H-hydrate dehydratase [Candidatus Micrarchaeota archaeon CG1_02_55_22]